MPRHYKSRKRDKVIDFAYSYYGFFLSAWNAGRQGIDSRLRAVLAFTSEVARRKFRYFQTTPVRTIITDFLAAALVVGILLFPIAMGILWIIITF